MKTKSRWVSWRMVSALLALPLLGMTTTAFAAIPSVGLSEAESPSSSSVMTSPPSTVYSSGTPATSSIPTASPSYNEDEVASFTTRSGQTVYLREGYQESNAVKGAGWTHMKAMHSWDSIYISNSTAIIADVLSDPLISYPSGTKEVFEGDFYQLVGSGYVTILIVVNSETHNIVTGYPVAGDYTTEELFGQTKSQMPFWLEQIGYTYN